MPEYLGTLLHVNASPSKYWAFISYSHRDAAVAATLHRALETYRLPKRLIGRATATGVVPPALKPIFRDRDELHASTDLKAVVRQALTESRYLIVLCSPDAARSEWVNQEIIEFKKLHGESRVLAVIARGEPFASNRPDGEAEECFPPALRSEVTASGFADGPALEPIAADLRPQGDGRRRATLKLIAGMVGVGIDELIQRDAARRARQLVWVAAASLAGMAAMTVLAVSAVRARNEARVQRNEAQLQRGEAEDLVEFMLGDLRKRLDAVGRLDVLNSVGVKALDYYARQDSNQLDANSLGRRSRALHLIGDVSEQNGRLDDALNAFKRGADTTAQLLQLAPNDPQRIFDHAQSVFWVGYLAWRRGRVTAAEESFQEYLALAQRLVAIDANKPEWQAELCYARNNIGVTCLYTGRAKEALAMFRESRDTFQRLCRAQPERAFDLGNTLGWLAKTHEALGEFREAIETEQAKAQALRAVPNAATNKRVQKLMQTVAHALAQLELDLGHLDAAEQLAREALQQAQAISAADPQNRFWLEELYVTHTLLAETQVAAQNIPAARANVRAALDGCAKLTALDATVARWHVNLRGRALIVAAKLAGAAERAAYIDELKAFLTQSTKFETDDRSMNATSTVILADAELVLGELLAATAHDDEAAQHWRAAVARAGAFCGESAFHAQALLAQAQFLLGSTGEARATAQRLATTIYRHPAYADLTHLLANGEGLLAAKSTK